ncbi:hypothetical protein [Liquorilactobacillus satsumensis]|uniref:hypothetical protein n=1 Tax=Liquorilactobacillus satsumensis TaxID=259059 RepID=UPI0039EB25E9
MELGSLSSWISGIMTFIAVVVALRNSRRDTKRWLKPYQIFGKHCLELKNNLIELQKHREKNLKTYLYAVDKELNSGSTSFGRNMRIIKSISADLSGINIDNIEHERNRIIDEIDNLIYPNTPNKNSKILELLVTRCTAETENKVAKQMQQIIDSLDIQLEITNNLTK